MSTPPLDGKNLPELGSGDGARPKLANDNLEPSPAKGQEGPEHATFTSARKPASYATPASDEAEAAAFEYEIEAGSTEEKYIVEKTYTPMYPSTSWEMPYILVPCFINYLGSSNLPEGMSLDKIKVGGYQLHDKFHEENVYFVDGSETNFKFFTFRVKTVTFRVRFRNHVGGDWSGFYQVHSAIAIVMYTHGVPFHHIESRFPVPPHLLVVSYIPNIWYYAHKLLGISSSTDRVIATYHESSAAEVIKEHKMYDLRLNMAAFE